MKTLAILGASGHGKVIAELAELNGYHVVFFDDAYPQKKTIEGWPILGGSQALLSAISEYEICVGIGNNTIRQQKQYALQQLGGFFPVLVHPSATISKYARLNRGAVVMAGAIVNGFADLKEGVVVNTGSVIEHDCIVEAFAHISPNSTLAGGVTIGRCAWVGAGTVVKQLVNIGERTVIGAGSVVIKDIPEGVTAFGVPARIKEGN